MKNPVFLVIDFTSFHDLVYPEPGSSQRRDHGGVTHRRSPIAKWRMLRSLCSRFMVRALSVPLNQQPPRTSGMYGAWTERVHSHTLPAMSSAPTGLREPGCEPTSSGPNASDSRPYVTSMFASSGASAAPDGNTRPSAPRAARSHSYSSHSRAPGVRPVRSSHAAYAIASSYDTADTGNRVQS